jgi:biotin operon repressor
MKRLLLTAASVAAAVLTLALSGCASDDGKATNASAGGPASSGPSGAADPFSKVIKYAECLQKHGLKVKIKPGDGYSLHDSDPKVKAAAEAACRSVAPPGMYDKPSAAELDKAVKVAHCLRDQGIKVEDPTEDHPQLRIAHPPANLRQLTDACEKKVGLHDGSGGSN